MPWIPPERTLEWRTSRSPGPGGQNVNKVESQVEVRLDLAAWPELPEAIRLRLLALAGRRVGKDGVLRVVANRHREQAQNRTAAWEKLEELIAQAAAPPPPERRPTRPTRGSKLRRLSDKRARSEIKKGRSDSGGG